MSKSKKEAAFDIDTAINNLEISNMFKAGLKFYIQSSNINIKSEKEFEKILKDYAKMEIGG